MATRRRDPRCGTKFLSSVPSGHQRPDIEQHLVIRDLGVAVEGRRLGHIAYRAVPAGWISDLSFNGAPALSARRRASLRAACTLLSRVKALLRTPKARRWPSQTR